MFPASHGLKMVLGSAQYKRQDDEVPVDEDVTSVGSDRLCDAPDGGHVRFVDSTIRYHLGSTSYWHSRSGLEKGLIIVCVILTLFSVIMVVIVSNNASGKQLYYLSHNKQSNATSVTTQSPELPKTLCLTEECVKVAGTILSTADLSQDPCEDFYQYACGGWERINPIPDGRTSWSMFEKLWEGNQLVMKNALEAPTTANMSAAELKAHDYYQSCMDDEGKLEKERGKPLLELVDSVKIGGWPIMDETPIATMKNMATFQNRLQYLQHDFQASGFFTWSVGEDDKNSSLHVIQIDQGGLSLPAKEYYNLEDNSSKPVLEAFREMIVEVAVLLIKDKEEIETIPHAREDAIRQRAQGVVDFEIQLANITIPSDQRRSEETLYHNMTVGELQKIAGFLNWTTFFSNVFSKVGRKISSKERVIVYAPTYLRNLTKLIHTYMTNDSLRLDLENYMVMQVVKTYRMALSKDYRQTGKGLEKALLGKESFPERWRVCVSDTDSVMGFALGAMFIRDSFDVKSKPEAQDMIDGVKEAFRTSLKTLKWMDEETRVAALEKADAITDMIGYPDFILDENSLNHKYENLSVSAGEYFKNNLRFHDYVLKENLAKLDKAVNRTKWSMSPPTVNAYYTPTKNQIVFPAGLLQIPFFNLDYPRSLNYGAMGVVMGHELSHAFDDQGREYDEKGNMRNWWNNKTLFEFKRRTSCMEHQYSTYNLGSTDTISGTKTLGENIADNGGLKTAYNAYQRWLEKETLHEQPLPGINLTHNQLFFLSFSQVWCSKQTPQAKKLQLLDDPHSPAKFRVIGVLSNSKEFADAFQCKPGTTMNPVEKCEVW